MMNDAMVKILGSGDAFGSGGRLQTCIYIETGSIRFLIDCGGTALISLKRFGLSTAIIDYIFLSHLHYELQMSYECDQFDLVRHEIYVPYAHH